MTDVPCVVSFSVSHVVIVTEDVVHEVIVANHVIFSADVSWDVFQDVFQVVVVFFEVTRDVVQ